MLTITKGGPMGSMKLTGRKSLYTSAALIALLASGTAVQAQEADDTSSSGDIVVTARKTSESLLDVPVAVSAVTEQDMEKRGVTSINDIARFTPSININNNAASRNDRSAQQLIMRGFTPSAFTNPTASLFIDGVPVSSSSAISIIGSPERIEVLKGPQSAYFGRNTFAGAINVVNGTPGTEWKGSVGGTIGTRSLYRLHADIEGPLAGDWLTFRVTGDRFSKDGSYKNRFDPSETLGDQRTTSGSLTLVAKPTPDLTLKAFGMLSRDHDGHSAQALVSAYQVKDAAGNIVVSNQSNCQITYQNAAGATISNPFFCGQTPKIDYTRQPSANTKLDSYIKNWLADPTGRLISPKKGVQDYGLKRRFYHLHFTADWDVGDTGVTLSSLTGYNNEFYSQLSDIDNYGNASLPNTAAAIAGGARTYFDYPFIVERTYKDFSQELRASYDNKGPIRATLGGSYLVAEGVGGLGGGNGTPTQQRSSVSGMTKSRTFGAFFGLTYDVTDALSLSVEGRYQIDKLYAFAAPAGFTATSDAFVPKGFYPGGSLLISKTYKNFLPRFIAQLDLSDDIMAYASYSKGVNPGLFNTAFLNFTEDQLRVAQENGIAIAVDPEKVTNYELGLKGKLFDRMLTFTLAAYYAPWRNQINALTINYAVNGVNQIIRGSANSGSTNMKGIELEGNLKLGRVDVNFAGSINDSSIKSFRNATVTGFSGITDFSGKQLPNTSKYSAALGVQYNGDLNAQGDTWFARADWNFKSGMYESAANLVHTPDAHFVNARLGIDTEKFSLSAFVNNVFNSKTPISINYGSLLVPGFPYSTYSSNLLLGLPDLRTFGLEGKYRF